MHPVPLKRFLKDFQKNQKDAIFAGVLKAFHARENHTADEWLKIVEKYKNKPVRVGG